MLDQWISGFCDELEKIAYDLKAAKKVLQAAKPLKLPKGSTRAITLPGTGMADIGSVSPIAAVAKPSLLPRDMHLGRSVAERAISTQVPEALQPEALQQVGDLLSHVGGTGQRMGARMPQGAIVRTKTPAQRGINQSIQRAGGEALPAMQTPEQHQILNSVLEGHEMDETMVPGGLGAKQFGHRSPEVLLREHNRVATLPSGSEPVRQYMQQLRGFTGETPALAEVGVQYGQGPRFSRHARRHLTDIMNARAADAIWG